MTTATGAIGTIEACFKKFGRETLVIALQAITQTGGGNAGFLTAPVIEGTCEALDMNERWRQAGQELFTAIERASIPRLYNLAMKERGAKKGPGVSVRALFAEAMKNALAKELGAKKASADKPIDEAVLSKNARDVLLIISDFNEPMTLAEVSQLSEAGAGRVPGILTSLAQMGCARATAGKWELTTKGRSTAEMLKAGGA